MRVVHFLNYCKEGGTVDMIVSLMQNSEYEHAYVTFEASDARKQEFEQKGLKLVEVGDVENAIAYMEKNADIVHAANSGGPEPGVHIGISAGKPVVETCQSPSLPSGHLDPNVTVVAVSNGILSYWPAELREKARVIYSCAESITDYNKQEARKLFNLESSRPVVGRLGRWEGIKRPGDFLEAAERIHTIYPDVQFLLAGDGNDHDHIMRAVNRLRADGMVIATPGFVSGRAKQYVYNAIDVFLYPTSLEGFGIVFAEAMSAGLPIVTYSDPVNIDVVGDAGVYVVDNAFAGTVDPYMALAYVTIDLLYNEREHSRLAERAASRYNKYYRPERMAKEYDQLYLDIWQEHKYE